MLNALRRRLRRGLAATRGYRIYAASVALAAIDLGPDLLNAIAGVDWSPLLPEGWGVRAGGWLAVARLVAPIVKARLRKPPAAPMGGPR
ncbi:hypothetical protein ABEV34_11810 [Methylorubrum rhodesianum]|uniref:hypothetical protein n=1 Tax=Methylorubrum TaxID=2282523 RepID=UPI001621B107|nr:MULTISPECIES: hypothetical protein [Methylorubrum]MBB5765724.1 hypothetical protein [Methylorubrum rhodesianum]MBI1691508.1 hypothetical protein [Methylorubrum sp. DB1722]